MKTGFNILKQSTFNNIDTDKFDNQLSIIEFVKKIRLKDLDKYGEYSVFGIENIFENAEDREELANYIYDILKNNSSYLSNQGVTFQIIVENADLHTSLGKPTIVHHSDELIDLTKIFGDLQQQDEDPNWFWQQLNVTS